MKKEAPKNIRRSDEKSNEIKIKKLKTVKGGKAAYTGQDDIVMG